MGLGISLNLGKERFVMFEKSRDLLCGCMWWLFLFLGNIRFVQNPGIANVRIENIALIAEMVPTIKIFILRWLLNGCLALSYWYMNEQFK